MNKETTEKLQDLHERLEELTRYGHCYALLNFDQSTICPKGAIENESETLQFIAGKMFSLTKREEYINEVIYLHDHIEELGEIDKRLIESLYKEYQDNINIDEKLDAKRNKIYTEAYVAWVEAKNSADYSKFSKHLESIIDLTEELVALRPTKFDVLYDNLIGDYEKNMNTKRLDEFFNALKERIVPLVKKIKNSKVKIRTDFLSRKVSIEKQALFSNYLLETIGFDFTRGMLSTTEHPFTSEIGYNDVRVTTHYFDDNFFSNVYSVIHEGGHAIFGQSEPKEYYDHHIANNMSMAMHESVSRFYENRIGRSREFIHLIYPTFHQMFEEFADVTEEELYKAVNLVDPSLIRTEADELTYSLHIIIRYEIEKSFADGSLKVKDAPKRWNELYKEYLGVEPQNDKEGILQDVHWSSGFGYFPTYALGNAYNAMYYNVMNKEMDILKKVEEGHIDEVTSWMREHVFKKASILYPDEWIKDITGRTLDPTEFLDYLESKYSELYDL